MRVLDPDILFLVATLVLLRCLQTLCSGTPSFGVEEGLEANVAIGNIKDLYSENTTVPGRFQLLSQSVWEGGHQREISFFHLEEISGSLFTTKQLDREEICPGKLNCSIALTIIATLQKRPMHMKVQVIVSDINDQVPIFPSSYLTFNLSESADAGTSIELPTAIDLDSPPNGVTRYFLWPSSQLFDLKHDSDQMSLKMILKSHLDREEQMRHRVFLCAEDGGLPSKTGTIEIHVHVIDANDNTPVFNHSSILVTVVKEDAPLEAVLLKLDAYDLDEGVNGEVHFRLADHSLKEYGNLFSVEEKSGQIKLIGHLDFENINKYSLSVMATDCGDESLTSFASVLVKVEDVNDNAPIIKLRPLLTFNHSSMIPPLSFQLPRFTVHENTTAVQTVAHISVSDADSGIHAQTDCHVSSQFFLLEQLYTNEFKLLTTANVVFDRETTIEHDILISCRDRGIPIPLTSSSQLTISVLDHNDNEPHFSQLHYYFKIPENSFSGSRIGAVSAVDDDIGDNGRVEYSIQSSHVSSLFEIDPLYGIISLKGSLDRENVESFEFLVKAKDHGVPAASSFANVTLEVLDENDEAPIFTESNYFFEVMENSKEKSIVGTVEAFDKDQPPNNAFLFSIHKNHNAGNKFHIDSTLGIITTLSVLDREATISYHLLVIASSSFGHPRHVSNVSVRVKVNDENDNKPLFVVPINNHSLLLSNTAQIGHVFLQLQATDADEGDNASLSYYLVTGNEGDCFGLNEANGNLFVDKPLDHIEFHEFILLLQVIDHGKIALSSFSYLRVIVSDSVNPQEALLFRSAKEFLSDESVAVALAILLAVILVLISVCTVFVWLMGLRRRQTAEKVVQEEEKNRAVSTDNGSKVVMTSVLPNGKPASSLVSPLNCYSHKMDLTEGLPIRESVKSPVNMQKRRRVDIEKEHTDVIPVVGFVKSSTLPQEDRNNFNPTRNRNTHTTFNRNKNNVFNSENLFHTLNNNTFYNIDCDLDD